MTMILALFLVTLCHIITNAEAKTWDQFHLTWSKQDQSDENPYAFDEMPITLDAALEEGFLLMDSNDQYKGDRYMRNNDSSNILIFDESELVGFQLQWLEKEISESATEWYKTKLRDGFFTLEERDGEKYFTATTYIQDPKTIGTDEEDSACQTDAGCGFWHQIGTNTDPENILKIPDTIDDMTEMWIRAKCVPRMGRHYVLNVTDTMDCMDFPTFTVLYVDNKLSAFNNIALGSFTFSPRIEGNVGSLSDFFYSYPDCLPDAVGGAGGLASLHLYFNENPQDFQCPPDED